MKFDSNQGFTASVVIWRASSCSLGCGEPVVLCSRQDDSTFSYCAGCGLFASRDESLPSEECLLTVEEASDVERWVPQGFYRPDPLQIDPSRFPRNCLHREEISRADFESEVYPLVGMTLLAYRDFKAVCSLATKIELTWHQPPADVFRLRARAHRALGNLEAAEIDEARAEELSRPWPLPS